MKHSNIVVFVLAVAGAVAAVALLALPGKESNEKSPRHLRETVTASTSTGTVTYLITFADRDVAPGDRCHALAEERGGIINGIYEEVNACSLTLPRVEEDVQVQEEIAALSDPSVLLFEEEQMVYAWDNEEGNNFYSSSAQRLTQQTAVSTSVWGIDRINQCSPPRDSTATPQDASNVVVFVIDTGIYGTHNEFDGMIGPTGSATCHYSAVSSNPLNDGNGHGTHVAGTICGKTFGVATKCTLCAVQVLSSSGSGTSTGVIAGINYAISRCGTFTGKRCVINMSLGSGESQSQNAAVAAAVANGIVVVVAAGNDNADSCNYSPASEPTAITVGSTTITDTKSSFSNYGSCVDVSAPGSSILSAWKGSNSATITISGTSMASPHVAGIAAGILSSNTDFTPAAVRNRIVSKAYNIPNTNIKLATVVDCGSNPATATPTRLPTRTPTTSTPTTSNPTSQKPTSSTPTSSTPTSMKPIAPMQANPVTTSSTPTSSKPTSSEPTSSMPTSSRPTSSKPTSSEPTSSRPTSSTPTSSTPTTSKPTSSPLSTLQAPLCTINSGGSSTNRSCLRQNGNMFHVDAKNANIAIISIAVSVASGTSAEVWTKKNSYIGFESTKSAWTKVADSTFSGAPGLISIQLTQNVTIAAGARQAFYVTMKASDAYVYYGANYADDTENTIVANNNDIVINRGTANAYQFGGTIGPRYFNGKITYRKI